MIKKSSGRRNEKPIKRLRIGMPEIIINFINNKEYEKT